MSRILKFAVAASSLTLIAGTVTVATAATASATDRANHCGTGYKFKKSWAIENISGSDTRGKTVGYIDIYWSSSKGKNCAIARPKNGVHKPRAVKIKIGKSGSGWAELDGYKSGQNRTKYAGPVYVKARGACIDFEGGFTYNASYDSAGAWGSYENKHCS